MIWVTTVGTLLVLALALAMAPDPEDWRDNALCAEADPEAFFPDKGGSAHPAKSICRRCLVRAECLRFAITNDERFGIWGGLSDRERRSLRLRLL